MFNAIFASEAGAAALAALGVALVALLVKASGAFVYIRNDKVGIVEKLWSLGGSVKDGFLALDGRAGFQPEILRGGLHILMPFQYRVHRQRLATVPQGTISYVFSRGGAPLLPGQTLATGAGDFSFEDARGFIERGGQRGPQRRILREGVYALNTAQFVVFTDEGDHAVNLGDAEVVAEMRDILEQRGGFTASSSATRMIRSAS
jgi:uncharacterized membrane protein YqiK